MTRQAHAGLEDRAAQVIEEELRVAGTWSRSFSNGAVSG
jgi:hypothetical protein